MIINGLQIYTQQHSRWEAFKQWQLLHATQSYMTSVWRTFIQKKLSQKTEVSGPKTQGKQ